MSRDFTYIDDLVKGVFLLLNEIPKLGQIQNLQVDKIDSKSPVAPFRVVNIGNSKPSKLLDFIEAIEKSVGIKAIKNLRPMQAGDVPATWADTSLLEQLTGYCPDTDIKDGVESFVHWFRDYYAL